MSTYWQSYDPVIESKCTEIDRFRNTLYQTPNKFDDIIHKNIFCFPCNQRYALTQVNSDICPLLGDISKTWEEQHCYIPNES